MKNIHYQALQSEARNDSFWAPRSLPLTLPFCLLPSLRSFPTSLLALSLFLISTLTSIFTFFFFYIAVRYAVSPFISFTKAVKFFSLSASAASPRWTVGRVKWNERNVQTLNGFHRHTMFSRFYNNWDPGWPGCCCIVDYLRQRDTLHSQSTPAFRVQIGIMPLVIIMISSATVSFPVDGVTACVLPSWHVS